LVSVGGIGGSGSRVVAEILQLLGYNIGNDLNKAKDNLVYTLLFKRQNILLENQHRFEYLCDLLIKISLEPSTLTLQDYDELDSLAVEQRCGQHRVDQLKKRVDKIVANNSVPSAELRAWKEPNTHIMIDRFLTYFSNLKYIYIYRNGLDMAFSKNQNQLRFWGNIVLNKCELDLSAKNSLSYWCEIHRRMEQLEVLFPQRIFMLCFEDLCYDMDKTLTKLMDFLLIEKEKTSIDELKSLIEVPKTIGRYKSNNLQQFCIEDLKKVACVYDKG